eukprot:COSAG02_NODE_66180_length_256_cov_0.656051_1_plen_30_part_01
MKIIMVLCYNVLSVIVSCMFLVASYIDDEP